ncbi:MAG: hypothetical protein ACQEXJ_20725 [Myxococcota bacterium]
MSRSRWWLAEVVTLVVLAGCGSIAGEGGEQDVPPVADADAVSGPEAIAEDGAADAEPDVQDVDSGPEAPDPDRVHERLTHSNAVTDEPFLEDRSRFWRTTEQLPVLDVRSVAAGADGVVAGTADGLFRLEDPEDGAFARVAAEKVSGAVRAVALVEGGIHAATAEAVFELEADGAVVSEVAVEAARDVVVCGEEVHVLHDAGLCRLEGGACSELTVPSTPVAVACRGGSLLVALEGGVHAWGQEGLEAVWSAPDGDVLTALTAGPGGFVAASGTKVFVEEDDQSVRTLDSGEGELPSADIEGLARDGGEGRLAVRHAVGVSLLSDAMETREHFQSQRWLPADHARGVAFDGEGRLWVATEAGVARLEKVPTTLADKAEAYFEQLNAFHWRLGGFVTPQAHCESAWRQEDCFLPDDDNDGQWTQEALGAFCYAYAVTGDERYYEAARKALDNMELLLDVPAVSFAETGLGYGFVSRSVVRDDEGAVYDSKATQGNWHHASFEDGHDYYWKDDTSSDETTGHFFGLPLYYDLCAKDDAERAEVASYVTGLAGYILDHDYRLVDLDGERTTHGYWAPESLAIAVDGLDVCVEETGDIAACGDAYFGSAYLNSTEILAAMVAAWHVSGEQRFLDAYETLVEEHRYDELVDFHDDVATWTAKVHANYCDHELADLAFLTLLRYDPYQERRERWARSMVDAFEYEEGERNPLKSLAMAAAMDEVPGLEAGVRTLHDYPIDLRMFRVDHSHRTDVERDGKDRHGDPQVDRVLPYDEIGVVRWDSNPYHLARGGDGSQRLTPTFWLLPYWGLRYHGAIE